MMDYAQACELFTYEPETGVLRAKMARKRVPAGSAVGCRDVYGYLVFKVEDRQYKVHRVAWLLTFGKWPDGEIDHINRVPGDNRLVNLRDGTVSQNQANSRRQKNNTVGLKGVFRSHGKYRASIQKDGKRLWLGPFDTPEQAHGAYCAAAVELFGEFARPG